MENKTKILSNHKKVKKKLLPPFLYKLGPLEEISWVKTILPELFWTAIVQGYHGRKRGPGNLTFSLFLTECSITGSIFTRKLSFFGVKSIRDYFMGKSRSFFGLFFVCM